VPASRAGIGLLPMQTVLREKKTVRKIRGALRANWFGQAASDKTSFEGYEIHVGETIYENGAHPLADLIRHGTIESITDGAVSESGRVLGTYVHGFFDKDDFRHCFIKAARILAGLAPSLEWANVTAERDARIDRLARHLRSSLNINLVKRWIVAPCGRPAENCRGEPR
jgi:adenosylcobyric acid synthase